MSQINGYTNLADYKKWAATRNSSFSTDTSDDAVITSLVENVSRYIDNETNRKFFPHIETRLYDVPSEGNARQVLIDDDLLEIITLTNGDATVLTTTDYFVLPRNASPKFAIQLKDYSSVYWTQDTNGSSEGVISVLGWYGYHQDYTQRAWKSVGATSVAITDTTTAGFTCTAGHTIAVDTITKINNEIFMIKTAGATAIVTDKRGDNGSTAIAHLTAQTVYEWQVMPDIRNACLQILDNVYSDRSGQNAGRISVTASGIVIRPEDVPSMAQKVIDRYGRQF